MHGRHRAAWPAWKRWLLPAAGFLSLLWFVLRVGPKPSRAAYPCQRAAAPLAGGFIAWLAALAASAALWRRGKDLWGRSRLAVACACFGVAVVLGAGALLTAPPPPMQAAQSPNEPIGIGKGIHPGRVVWAHDPAAARWEGPGNGHWWEPEHTSQAAVDRMMSASLRTLTGKSTDREAWDALIRHFNRAHGKGDTGYRRGEKVTVKVNFVGAIVNGRGVDPETYRLSQARPDYMNTSPQMIVALLRQLVREAGVDPRDIAVGDPLSLFPEEYYEMCRREFPAVRYLDHRGGTEGHPRTRVEPSSVPLYWSCRPEGKEQDYVPTAYAEAAYLINMANLKGHASAGVTLTAKNHYGSLIRTPPQKGYYDMHGTLAREVTGSGHYRALVDLVGHAHMGGKTLVYFIDGLYPGKHPRGTFPLKWTTFDGQWASSLLASQDPVAIDSVGFDFLWAEWDDFPHIDGTDDYLHEAALANDPPSGTFYDPNHPKNTVRLASLGVHEHWNNPRDRQYSRNLGKGHGIELVRVEPAAR